MNTTLKATIAAARIGIALGLVALTGVAAATNTGTTDIWRNQFRESFGAPASSAGLAPSAAYSNGSTDIWRNEFRQSFGASDASVSARSACGTGSTDIWANDFSKSFGSTRAVASIGPIQMCEAARSTVR